MPEQNLVAVYASDDLAEKVRDRLIEIGVPASDIRLSAEGPATAAPSAPVREHEGGWFSWLFGQEVPSEDCSWYATNLGEGRTAVSVYLRAGERERVQDVMEEFGPIDIDEERAAPLGAGAPKTTAATSPEMARGTEEVIPVAKEELDIGKRETERRYRVRSYVVEHPVEEQVHLRDERVVIERRPAADASGLATGDLGGRDVEIVERDEEPGVAKRARKTEEVVVRKETRDRVEPVRDTVRETKVDVDRPSGSRHIETDRAAAGNKPSVPPAGPAEITEDAARDPGAVKADTPRGPLHDPKI
jgi:stress response protein YsnF